MLTKEIKIWVNGSECTFKASARMLLVHFLRNELNLTGTKIGCEVGACGACTVILDGKAVKSCMVLAVSADGSRLFTIEGLGKDEIMRSLADDFTLCNVDIARPEC